MSVMEWTQRKFKSECSDDVLKDILKDMKCLMALIKLIQVFVRRVILTSGYCPKTSLHLSHSRSELVNDPTTPSFPPSAKQLEDLFQPLFDDDEEFPPAIQTPSVRVNAALAPEMATGSPSITINTEDAPAAITSYSKGDQPLRALSGLFVSWPVYIIKTLIN
ncbi:hypothetical protein Tco_0862358 [Tanacetum coccineum]